MILALKQAGRMLALALLAASARAQPPADLGYAYRPAARQPAVPEFLPAPAAPSFTLPPASLALPAEPSALRYAITAYAFEGNSAIPTAALDNIAREFVGPAVGVADLEELRQRLTRHYLDQGYANSGVIVPEQPLRDGVFHFQVIEGRLSAVRVKGQGWLREGYVANRLARGAEQPLNVKRLQENIRKLLGDPLIAQLNSHLRPGDGLGQAILEVQVTPARPYQLSLLGNNFRPPSVGAENFGVNGWLRNLTGLGDYLALGYTTSAGADTYSGSWSIPLGDLGTMAFFHFDEGTYSVVEEPLRSANIDSQIHVLEGGISHPVLDRLDQRLTLGASFATRENETRLLGEPFSFVRGLDSGRNQATVVRLSQEYLHSFTAQALALRSTFSVGVNALGSVAERDRSHPDSEFFSWLGQAQYAWRLLDNGAQLLLRGDLQLSNEPLLPLEQIAVGGHGSVRGYRENQLVRDEGYSAALALHYPLWAASGLKLDAIPFMDYGAAWNHGERADYLHALGIGLQAALDRLHADFYWAHPLNNPPQRRTSNLQDQGIFFQVRLDVFP